MPTFSPSAPAINLATPFLQQSQQPEPKVDTSAHYPTHKRQSTAGFNLKKDSGTLMLCMLLVRAAGRSCIVGMVVVSPGGACLLQSAVV